MQILFESVKKVQFSVLALQLFKERYQVPVSEDALEKLQQFDQQVAGLDVNTPAFNLTIDQ